MALSDTAIRNAKPREKPFKMGDSDGLFLLVQPSGGKLWRLKHRIEGLEKKLSLGTYPEVGLGEARKRRDAARELLAAGKDPAREKQQAKLRAKAASGDTFEEIAKEYGLKREREGLSPRTAEKATYYLAHLTPSLGRLPIGEITPTDILGVLRKIEAKGSFETARRVLQLASRVCRFAVATARLGSDPTRDLKGALTTPKPKHFGAIVEAKGGGELLRAIDGYEGHAVTKLALALSPHVFVRPGELRHAVWEEIDLDAAIWAIPAEKMKMRRPHSISLSRQTIAIFETLRGITGPAGYAFPSIRTNSRPMSENTVNAALRRLGLPAMK